MNQKEIAALCFLSESRFRHLFRRQMHMSFQDYVAKLRYLDARRRIASGIGSISDAVREAGFSNHTAFIKCSRRMRGSHRWFGGRGCALGKMILWGNSRI